MQNKVILVTSDQLGKGDPELGETILETFFTLLKQGAELPHAIFFMNRGVIALTNKSLVSVHLKELQEKGVKVLACKTCVDYYQVEDQLVAGEISGMNRFLELAAAYQVLTIA